jgi:hypothetical protein
MQEAKEVLEAAPGVEGKLVEMLDALQNGVVTVGEQVVKYGPDVADAALWVVRVDGIQSIVSGFVALLILTASVYAFLRTLRWVRSDEFDNDEFTGIPFFIGSIVIGIGSIVIGIVSSMIAIDKLLNVWNWIAIFEPKLWLAKQIMASVLK